MIAAFIGGGSLRLLPIFRGIFLKAPEVFRDGEIRLIDLQKERAEAVAKLTAACPEYKDVQCRITAASDTDRALEGIDVLYLTMGAIREPSQSRAFLLSREYDYIFSDQLSINGAFLSLRLGFFILDLAKKPEKLIPSAKMLIISNPVSVYSCMVNIHTKIRALGICGGFNNHRWDLSRFCGRDEFDPDWNVVSAGVNHLSFILRGEYRGEDLFRDVLPRYLNDSWKCMTGFGYGADADFLLEKSLKDAYRLYRTYNVLFFSSEYDGWNHVIPGNEKIVSDMHLKRKEAVLNSPEACVRSAKEAADKRFAALFAASRSPETVPWRQSYRENCMFGTDPSDITIPILKALCGFEKMRISASRPNCGAIAGLPEMAAAEYSMEIFKDTITPAENLYIPSPFHGLIASLSEFQTLLADAIAMHDPALFAAALDAYPVHRFEPRRKEYFRKMFDVYSDVDPVMRRSSDMLF